jgi:hypothetical protein
MSVLGTREVITELHGDDAPQTYTRGSFPIDGIFMTRDLYILQGVYLPFGKGIGSYHRCLWIDIRVIVLMGQSGPPEEICSEAVNFFMIIDHGTSTSTTMKSSSMTSNN